MKLHTCRGEVKVYTDSIPPATPHYTIYGQQYFAHSERQRSPTGPFQTGNKTQ